MGLPPSCLRSPPDLVDIHISAHGAIGRIAELYTQQARLTAQVGWYRERQAVPLARSQGDHCIIREPVVVTVHDKQLRGKAVGIARLIYVGRYSLPSLWIVRQVGEPDRDIGIIAVTEIGERYLQ